jgi:hypothetical protein
MVSERERGLLEGEREERPEGKRHARREGTAGRVWPGREERRESVE